MSFTKKFGSRAARTSLSALVVLFGLATSAHAAPTCVTDPKGTLTDGSFVIQNNMFGAADDATGTQNICMTPGSANAWSSTWTWAAGTGATKSYPNMYIGWNDGKSTPDSGFPYLISYQYQVPTSVEFKVSGTNTFAVGYRMYFSPDTAPDKASAEMQVWLNYAGMLPKGKKIYSNASIGVDGETWDTWKGVSDEGWPLTTFVKTSPSKSFSGKLQPFVYCMSYTMHVVDKTWYALGLQFGAWVVQSNGAKGSLTVTKYEGASH
jgi:xyloglucan-specific endo-beta-1,4-glucanase